LLTKRTHLVPVLILALAFPAVAIASGGEGDGTGSHAGSSGPGVAGAELEAMAPLRRPIESFQHLIRVEASRIQAERRAAVRRRQRELLAHLPDGVSLATLDSIAACESGGDPTAVSSDGSYRGKYQFDLGTWESVGGHGDPVAAPEAEQDYRAALLYSRSGSSPWPVCG
jgi:transglycosylase-like protein